VDAAHAVPPVHEARDAFGEAKIVFPPQFKTGDLLMAPKR